MKDRVKIIGFLFVIGLAFYGCDGENVLGNGANLGDNPGVNKTGSAIFVSNHQVYAEDGSIYAQNMDVTGIPYICTPVTEIEQSFPSSTLYPDMIALPWTVPAQIRNGKISFELPANPGQLPDMYGLYYTDGVHIAQVYLDMADNTHTKIRLHKYDESENWCRINIFYADAQCTKFYDGNITLEPGWNFVESCGIESGVSVSQNIEEYINKGYMWHIEYWD
jgi:hypothetical protein